MSLPAGTITFLLTDIEGSSRLWQERPDEMGAIIERHDELIRQAVESHGGVFVKSKGEGDSTFSVFARPTDAVTAAVEMQRALEVPVRAALHTGEAELRDGDYYGNTVNRCARLRGIAHGGQTICSQVTAELVADSVPLDITLLDLGSHRLRDLDRAQRVYQICASDLATDFPALRSLDSRPNNLPPQLTTFIGREAEMDVIRKLLKADRLITLTGSGGCGKTRLAIQVAADVLDDYTDGVWCVELAPLADPALVPNAVAQAVGVREARDEAIAATLERILAERRVLIVLDNCEHVVDACATLSHALLRACPQLSIMTTSREPLGVEGETTWRVPSLGLPEGVEDESLTTYEAVRLFIDRAVRARPTFEVTNDNAPAVAQICRRVDGLPLAIELAAARVRVMTLDQIATGLDDAFRVLGGGARTSLPRQRTLEASVDWSHKLLNDEQRVLFRRLAVFAGTFALDSVEAVCSGEDVESHGVFNLLVELVDRSLVQDEEDGGRYRLLETIRQYARQKLADAGEADAVSLRHLEHFTDLMERARPHIEGGGTVEWMARLRRERDNLRAAMDWAAETGRAREGLQLATAWPDYWGYCGNTEEGRLRVRALRDVVEDNPTLQSRAFVTLTGVGIRQGRFGAALRYRESAITLAQEAGDPFLEVRALITGGWMLSNIDPGNATRFWSEAIEKAATAEDAWGVRFATMELSVLLWWRGDVTRARQLLASNVEACRNSGDLLTLAICLCLLGACDYVAGHLETGEQMMREAVAIGQATGDVWLFPQYSAALADIFVYRGRTDEARGLIEEVISATSDTGNIQAVAVAQCTLAVLEFAEGNTDAALAAAERGAITMRDMYPWYSTRAFSVAGWAVAAQGDRRRAAEFLEEATNDSFGIPFWVCVVEWNKALVELLFENFRSAEDHARTALAQGLRARPDEREEGSGAPSQPSSSVVAADALEVLAAALSAQGDHEEAARLFGAAQSVRDRGGPARFASQVQSYESSIATLRAEIGDEAFEAAWAAGAALSSEEAIAYALRGRGERKRPSSGWESLTPTELEVVKLVADGLSNPQIAEKMFISRRTVTTHLTHIFAKLGISSRTELATEATRRGALA